MMETANKAGTAMKLPGIEARIEKFAANITKTLKKDEMELNIKTKSASGSCLS